MYMTCAPSRTPRSTVRPVRRWMSARCGSAFSRSCMPLVDDVASGRVDLAAVPPAQLPAHIAALPTAERRELIAATAEKRETLKRQIAELAAERDAYIDARLETEGSAKDSLDLKIYEAVRAQAAPLGIDYDDGPRF